MNTLDLTVIIKCFSNNENVKITKKESLNDLLEDIKDDFVYEGIVDTYIKITENVSKQVVEFKTKKGVIK